MVTRLLPAIATLGALLAVAGPAAAQAPPCAELQVNTYTTGRQRMGAVASAADGRFVVTWMSYLQDGDAYGVWARRFDAFGTPLSPEFQVSSTTAGFQGVASIGGNAAGNFVVVWNDSGGGGAEIFARRFDPSGVPLASEFRVNTFTTGIQSFGRVALDAAGGFVVVWESVDQDGDGFGVFGQRFDASGDPVSPEFRANTTIGGSQAAPHAAAHADGSFVVVWYGPAGGSFGVFGRRYDAQANPLGSEFRVDDVVTFASRPAVSTGPDGGFVVVWETALAPSGSAIDGQRYDAAGARLGPAFRVSTYTTGQRYGAQVARDADGGFVVVWVSGDQDGSGLGIFGQRFDAAFARVGGEFQVNATTAANQTGVSVAPSLNRAFVAAWDSFGQDGSDRGIFANRQCSRFHTTTPCRLVDTRDPPGPAGGPPLAANSTRAFPVTGACGIPSAALAVALNVTAVNPTDLGNLRVYPSGLPAPLASTVNFVPGRTRAGNATVPVGAGGDVAVRCDMPAGSTGSTHLVLDVFGYFQ